MNVACLVLAGIIVGGVMAGGMYAVGFLLKRMDEEYERAKNEVSEGYFEEVTAKRREDEEDRKQLERLRKAIYE